ncbi:LOG family protein, partial [bacterium LRH843]|nr:LOG family protein [bacterium LRH843]
RKMMMFERSDAFIILPGGFGTMDETFEVITWKQLHTHNKPIILYNFDGFWDNWIRLTEQFIDQKFASENTRHLYEVVD